MEEAEYLCDEIAIINKGRIIATDTPTGLKQKHGGVKAMEIKLREAKAQEVMQLVKSVVAEGAAIETPDDDTIRVSSSSAQELLVTIVEALSKNGIQIETVSVNPPSLEEVFLRVIGGGKN
jgi:ABC-2 type transport system ATP-binding protein